MTASDAFCKIVVVLAPHLSATIARKNSNPMPRIKQILEELENDTFKRHIDIK